jgi:hypothetical protein
MLAHSISFLSWFWYSTGVRFCASSTHAKKITHQKTICLLPALPSLLPSRARRRQKSHHTSTTKIANTHLQIRPMRQTARPLSAVRMQKVSRSLPFMIINRFHAKPDPASQLPHLHHGDNILHAHLQSFGTPSPASGGSGSSIARTPSPTPVQPTHHPHGCDIHLYVYTTVSIRASFFPWNLCLT